MRPTAKERILLHLLERVRPSDDVEVSSASAQEGVARGAGVDLRHLAQFIRPLIQDGLVRERSAHVTGIRQRRKVYDLTPSGRALAIRLRDRVKAEGVPFLEREAAGAESLLAAIRDVGTRTSTLEAVPQVEPAGPLEREVGQRPSESAFVDQTWDAPPVGTFVGRKGELAEILREDRPSRTVVIRGMAGIGKTALAAKACDLLRGRRNLFWHRIRPWETDQTLLACLGRFLKSLDRPGLNAVLKRGEAGLAAEVFRQDLPGAHAFLIFDDAHEASAAARGVLQMLTEAVASAPDVTVLVLTRRALPFYDVRDVAIRGMVQEFELAGLKPEEAAVFLAEGGAAAGLEGLGRRLAGHPLFLELVRGHPTDIPLAVRDVRRFIEETVYQELSGAERIVMKAASLYQVPVPRQTLLSIPGSSSEALATLQNRSLVRFVGGDRYEVHDTIRELFRDMLTPTECRAFEALAVGELRGLAAKRYAAGDFVSTVGYLSNAVRLSRSPRQSAEIRESLGDAQERVGDLPAALVSLKEACRLSTSSGSVARLHRKLAFVLQALGETRSASAEAEAGFQSLGDADDVERGWLSLARSRMCIAAENWDEGRTRAEAALRTFQSFHDPRGQAEALIDLAVVQVNSSAGKPELASGYLAEALRLAEPVADPPLTAGIRVQLANLYAYRLGDADRAMDHLRVIEALPGVLADVRSRQSLLMLKGWLNLDLRADFGSAREDFLEALDLSQKLHDPITAVLAKHGAAMAGAHAGDYVAAREQLEAVASELLARSLAGSCIEALWSAAEICLATGDLPGFSRVAARLQDPALTRGLEARPVLARVIEGIECLRMGDRSGVHAAFLAAIHIAEQEVSPQERPLAAFAHDMYGVALGAMGESREAAEQDWLAVESAERFGLEGRLHARPKIMDGIQDSLRRMFPSPPMAAR